MIKHISYKIFFISALLAQPTLRADWPSWYKDKPNKETFEAAARLAEQRLEEDLQPHKQSPEIKEQILTRKKAQAQKISQIVGLHYLSKTQTKDMAKTLARDVALDLALELMLNETVARLEESIQAFNKVATQQEKEKIVAKVTENIISKLRWYSPATVLQEFTKPDYHKSTKIEQLINQEVAKLPDNFHEKYFSENDITEIYPEHKIGEMNQRVINGKIWREKECCVCGEEFKTVGKRVNLECGHSSLCPKCALEIIHFSNNKKCPLCRAVIDRSDFSVKYLKSKTNDYDLDLIKKLDLEAYKKIIELFKRN